MLQKPRNMVGVINRILEYLAKAPELNTLIGLGVFIIIVSILSWRLKSNRILNIIPGTCTGTGVLFTFIVLYVQLKDFHLEGNDDNFLEQLVRQLTSAFSTSILGIFLSLISAAIIKAIIENSEIKKIRKKPYFKKHPLEYLEELSVESKAMHASIRTFNDVTFSSFAGLNKQIEQLRESIGISSNSINNTLREESEKERDLLESGLEGIALKIQASNQQIEKSIEEHGNSIRKGFSLLDEKLVSVIGQVRTELTTLNQIIGEVIPKLRENLEQALQKLGDQLEEHIKLLGQQAFKESKDIIQKINQTLGEKAKETFSTSWKKITEIMEKVEGRMAELDQNLNAMTKRIHENTEMYRNELKDTMTSIKTSFAEKTGEMSNTLETQTDKIQQSLSENVESMNKLLVNIKNEFQEKLQSILDENLKHLEESFKNIEDWQLLSEVALSDATQSFSDAIVQYQNVSNNQGEIISEISNQLNKYKELQEHMIGLLDRNDALLGNIEVLENRITDIGNVITSLDQIRNRVNGSQDGQQ